MTRATFIKSLASMLPLAWAGKLWAKPQAAYWSGAREIVMLPDGRPLLLKFEAPDKMMALMEEPVIPIQGAPRAQWFIHHINGPQNFEYAKKFWD